MNADAKRLARADELTHERARTLAAESVDVSLEQGDAEWLAGHLGSCPDCAAVAEEYRTIHGELHSLQMPEPPRDLWARTAAALDAADATAARRSPGRPRAARTVGRPLISTAIAVGFVVVVAAASLLNQSPISTPAPVATHSALVAIGTATPGQPSLAPQGQLTVVNGTSYWISSDRGTYEIKGGTAQCSTTDRSCTVANRTGQTLGTIASDSAVSAAIDPDAVRAVVWTKDKIAVLPLAATSQTVMLDQLTPRPTSAANPTAAQQPTPTGTPLPTGSPAGSAPESAPVPTATPTAIPTATPTPTATPAPATASMTAPKASASVAAEPTVILSGYEIVGCDPQFSPDGSLLAFSARPVDHSAGPDVFLWRVGQEAAEPVTSRHGDLLGGWYGQQMLVSEISAGGGSGDAATTSGGTAAVGTTSYIFDPSTGATLEIGRPMLLPVVDPTGRFLIYWVGTVKLDPASGLWQPAAGSLYFDRWSDLALIPASLGPVATPTASTSPAVSAAPTPAETTTPTPTPTLPPTLTTGPTTSPAPTGTAAATQTEGPSTAPATESASVAGTSSPTRASLPQILPVSAAPGAVQDWVVRWDASGQHVAVWVAESGSSEIGRLSLFSIDPTTGQVDTNEPLMGADKVLAGIEFDDGHLVYTSAVDGKTYMQAIPAVPESTVSTPVPATATPTVPDQLPSGAIGSGSRGPRQSDRPGN